jgi:predicted GNAT family acetyltransferase
MTADGVQLLAHELGACVTASDRNLERLGDDDFPAMVALATTTKPGPFATRTPSLGTFWDVKDAGMLIAMAGERMRHDGFTEVSGVCVPPAPRGRGLARMLSALVAERIVERGETPYLHAYATNTAAIRLYESLGFRLRSKMHVAAIALHDASRAAWPTRAAV